MKVQYNLKQTELVLIDYTADLTPEQFEFVRTLLYDATKHNVLFARPERE